jgi:hypothetical protein
MDLESLNVVSHLDPRLSTLDTSPYPDVLAKYRLEIYDRRPVHRLQAAYPHPATVNLGNLHPVQTDGIGAVR